MANENTRFYITANDQDIDAIDVTIATGNTPGNSSILEVSIAKASLEGTDGKTRTILLLEKVIRKIHEAAWPAI